MEAKYLLELNINHEDYFIDKEIKNNTQSVLNRISEIEKKNLEIKEMMQGDYVLLADGSYRMIVSVLKLRNQIQLSGGEGHYCCVFDNGECLASGTLDSPIQNTFTFRGNIKSGRAWSFLFGPGGGKGVQFEMNFKVWEI